MDLIARHIPPTDPNDHDYQYVKHCDNCRYHKAASDANPLGHICPRCGSTDITTIIARWVRTSPRWQVWKNEGYWQQADKRRWAKGA